MEILVRRFIGVQMADEVAKAHDGKKNPNAWVRMDVLQCWGTNRHIIDDMAVRRLNTAATRQMQLYGYRNRGRRGGGRGRGGTKSDGKSNVTKAAAATTGKSAGSKA